MALKMKIKGQKISAMFTMLIYTCSEYTVKIIYSDFIGNKHFTLLNIKYFISPRPMVNGQRPN